MSQHFQPNHEVASRTPAGNASPVPPESGRTGGAKRKSGDEATPEVVGQQQVASTSADVERDLLHQQGSSAGDESITENFADEPSASKDANPGSETDSSEAAAHYVGAEPASPEPNRHPLVVKPATAIATRRNQPLTPSEEDRCLLLLSYGASMRQAASAIGCCHSTLVKRAQRDEQFSAALDRAREQARADPLLTLHEASKKSWRAAAWLLGYLERRDNRSRAQSPTNADKGEVA
jgi:hypothetical protein